MQSNPFSGYGKPATPEQFCGRRKNLRRIFDRISQKAPVSIVGERRIGKTSLLHYIKSEQAMHEFSRSQANTLFVSLECKSENMTQREFWLDLIRGLEEISMNKPWHSLLQDILRTLNNAESSLPIYEIEQAFHRIKAWGYTPVFLVDEFDRALFSKDLDVHFFNTIRSFMVGEDDLFVMVVASRIDLYKAPTEIVGSPFFNVFSTEQLQEFSENDFEDWLQKRLAGTNVMFDNDAKQWVINVAGMHPFFSQIIASEIFYGLEQDTLITDDERQEMLLTFKQNAIPHFVYYWEHSSEEEKVWLSLLSLGKKASKLRFTRYEDTNLQELRKRSLVRKVGGEYQVFSSVFSQMVRDDVYTATRGDTSTYEKFLEEFKSNQPKERISRMAGSAKAAFLKINPKYWSIFLHFMLNKEDPSMLLEEVANALAG